MKNNFPNQGQSLIGIIIVLIVVGLFSGGLYYYFSKQIPEIPEVTEKPAEEEIIKPEEEITPPEEVIHPEEVVSLPEEEKIPQRGLLASLGMAWGEITRSALLTIVTILCLGGLVVIGVGEWLLFQKKRKKQ